MDAGVFEAVLKVFETLASSAASINGGEIGVSAATVGGSALLRDPPDTTPATAAAPSSLLATGATTSPTPAPTAAEGLASLRDRRLLQAEATELLLDLVKLSVSATERGQSCPVLKLCSDIREEIVAAQALRKRFGNVRGLHLLTRRVFAISQAFFHGAGVSWCV